MGAVSDKGISIAELVVYIPVTLLAIFVVFRHGFHKQLGWIYLCIFGGIRIAGAILEILSTQHPDNTNDTEWAMILQSVGLSPLLLSTLGLLKRVFDETTTRAPSDPNSNANIILQGLGAVSGIFGKVLSIYSKKATAVSRRSRATQLLHIPALIALILSISGGSDEASSNVADHSGGQDKVRGAIIVYLLVYLAVCLLWVITTRDLGSMNAGQKRIFSCVFLALPLIAVRLLYSLISAFGHNSKFSILGGDPTIKLVMATIEEFLVVVIYTILGLGLSRSTMDVHGRPQQAYPMASEEGSEEYAPGYNSVPYAKAGAQQAYDQHYARQSQREQRR
ncbi:hypothetical protein N7456_005541 [Penicillium angulare]|uniref:DUF7702 domain-containing protein n=1 Tax=Penicillium angulare TaxID=116970 RepID=A0A9W9FYJ3_9EURO|nr:hypothetical protein N7456_005541 [Penicillium angulare]